MLQLLRSSPPDWRRARLTVYERLTIRRNLYVVGVADHRLLGQYSPTDMGDAGGKRMVTCQLSATCRSKSVGARGPCTGYAIPGGIGISCMLFLMTFEL